MYKNKHRAILQLQSYYEYLFTTLLLYYRKLQKNKKSKQSHNEKNNNQSSIITLQRHCHDEQEKKNIRQKTRNENL